MPRPSIEHLQSSNRAANALMQRALAGAGLSTEYTPGIIRYRPWPPGSIASVQYAQPGYINLGIEAARSTSMSPNVISTLINENWHVYVNQMTGTTEQNIASMTRMRNWLENQLFSSERTPIPRSRRGGARTRPGVNERAYRSFHRNYERQNYQYYFLRENRIPVNSPRFGGAHGMVRFANAHQQRRFANVNEQVSHLMSMYAAQQLGFQSAQGLGMAYFPYGISTRLNDDNKAHSSDIPQNPGFRQRITLEQEIMLPSFSEEGWYQPQTPPNNPGPTMQEIEQGGGIGPQSNTEQVASMTMQEGYQQMV